MIEVAKADYRCRFDCVESGCEGHTVILKFDSEADTISVNNGLIYFAIDTNYMKAIIFCLKQLSDIPEIQGILDAD